MKLWLLWLSLAFMIVAVYTMFDLLIKAVDTSPQITLYNNIILRNSKEMQYLNEEEIKLMCENNPSKCEGN